MSAKHTKAGRAAALTAAAAAVAVSMGASSASAQTVDQIWLEGAGGARGQARVEIDGGMQPVYGKDGELAAEGHVENTPDTSRTPHTHRHHRDHYHSRHCYDRPCYTHHVHRCNYRPCGYVKVGWRDCGCNGVVVQRHAYVVGGPRLRVATLDDMLDDERYFPARNYGSALRYGEPCALQAPLTYERRVYVRPHVRVCAGGYACGGGHVHAHGHRGYRY